MIFIQKLETLSSLSTNLPNLFLVVPMCACLSISLTPLQNRRLESISPALCTEKCQKDAILKIRKTTEAKKFLTPSGFSYGPVVLIPKRVSLVTDFSLFTGVEEPCLDILSRRLVRRVVDPWK